MKSHCANLPDAFFCRSPCGERGLKSFKVQCDRGIIIVAPRAGSVG